MGMDVDYVVATQDLVEIQALLDSLPHGEREAICDEIAEFKDKLNSKYNDFTP